MLSVSMTVTGMGVRLWVLDRASNVCLVGCRHGRLLLSAIDCAFRTSSFVMMI